MESITIQLCKKYQYPLVKKLSRLFAKEINYTKVILKQLCKYDVFVIKHNSIIVGYALAKKDGSVLNLTQIYILPKYRNIDYYAEILGFIKIHTKATHCTISLKSLISSQNILPAF